jgi:hypothetical protein
MKSSGHLRHILGAGLAGTLLLAAGCATKPPTAPVALTDEGEGESKFNTGRVVVVLTDYEGQPLRMARVDLESGSKSKDYFRTAAMSDHYGRASFNGVPTEVRISVYHAESQGNYSREFHIPPSGVPELRMMIERTVE